MAGLDYVRAIQSGEIPPPPIAVVMNFSIAELEEGRAVFDGEPGEEHYNPIGVVHGGYASTILDSALGCAVHTTLPAGVGYTSQTLEVKYLRPITRDTGAVRAEAEVVHRGRKTATSEARLTSVDTGKLLATGTSTCLIFDLIAGGLALTAMPGTDAKHAVLASYDALNESDIDAAMEALAEDAEWHESEVLPDTGVYRGRMRFARS